MGSDEIYDALLKQSGAIRVDTMENSLIMLLSQNNIASKGELVIFQMQVVLQLSQLMLVLK